jgi:biopolymer transport protein ExbD
MPISHSLCFQKKLLLILITIAFLTSYGQQSKVRKEPDLVMPLETGNDKPTAEDYRHSVELRKERAILSLNGKKQLVLYKSLGSAFKKNKANIRSKIFSIITLAETPYKIVVDVLDLLVINDVRRYKILRVAERPNDQPTLKTEIVTADSSFLRIKIGEQSYRVEHLNKTSELKDSIALSQYLLNNMSKIDPEKILLEGPANLPYASFRPLLDALRKNGLYKFKMVTNK